MSHLSIVRRSALPAIGLLAITLVACNDVAGVKRGTVSLSFTGGSAPTASVMTASSPSATSAPSAIVITKAQVVFSHVELKQTESSTCATDTQEHDDCEEIELSPMLVDLPVSGVSQNLTVTVPAGTYRAIEAKIDVVQSGEPGATEFLAAHPDWADRSLHVEGTYNGTPFVYDLPVEAEVEMPFNPPVTVAEGSNNLTIDIGLPGWFKDSSGTPLDPSNSANFAAIAASIRGSFHAFEDDNRDGKEDH